MEVSHVASIHGSPQLIIIGRKLHPVLLNHVRRTTHRRSPVVTLLYHRITRTRHHKAGRSRNVEGVLSITTRTHDIQRLIFRQIHRHPHLQQGIGKAGQLLYGNVTHQKHRDKRSNLGVGIFAGHHILQYLACLLLAKILVFKQSV